ncbi:MAG: HAD family hydrolase [Verrucomicrobiota bacterium]|nr:HAD family hydrolase [Verrucomicrobiota bacterium]
MTDERRPAVFFDRDGTLMLDVNYCGNPEDVHVFPDAAKALRRLKDAGYTLIVITNQSGIGRGYFTEEAYRAVEQEVERQLGSGLIDATYFCPDHPDKASARRKPEPGMIFEAARDHDLDLARSFFVGDKPIDAECGRKAGARTILLNSDAAADWRARSLTEAANIILANAT